MPNDQAVKIVDNRLILNVEPVWKYPVLRPDNSIMLYVNGQPKREPIIISNEEEVNFEIVEDKQCKCFDIKVTQDKLKVYLTVNPFQKRCLRPIIIKDPSKIGDFLITTKEETTTSHHPVKPEDVYRKLGELGIQYGLSEEAIERAIANPGEKVLIAEGLAPVDSVDEEIDYLFKEDEAKVKQEKLAELKSSADKVDFFGFRKTYSVQLGQIIAVKKPARLGKPGIDVFGEEIPVRKPKTVDWKIGNGVKIINDKAVAIVMGRPVLEKGRLSVYNIYEVENDVDICVGSIDYNGDVVVNGDVCDNYSVKATGDIRVGRNVSNAYMEAVGSIMVAGNIISSKIIAGGACVYQQALEKGLRTLFNIFSEIEDAVVALKKEDLFRNLSEWEVVYGLLETKYSNTPVVISELFECQKQLEADVQLSELLSVLNELKIFLDGTKHQIDRKQLGVLTRKIGRLSNFYSKIDNPEASIYANYIQNSFIEATGDIIVQGKGAYNSILEASGNVKITGLPGVFRGGRIKAGKGVVVSELGSVGGSRVDVQVDERGSIRAEKVYDNVFINIGGRLLKLNKEMRNINARLDQNGQIILF
jgi:uncharacterized protein (DUF342 family)